MGRTYEALKRAEHERVTTHEPIVTSSVNGRRVPPIPWNYDNHAGTEYERIRVSITSTRGAPLRTLAVVACRAGSGSTTTAVVMARSLASAKRSRVLLVDANFRTSSLDLVFDARNTLGLTEVLCDDKSPEDHVQPTDRENLFLLTTGGIPSTPGVIFDRTTLEPFVSRIKKSFDYVIFDAAPVLEFPATTALAAAVDGALLVLNADHTSVDEARTARAQLERAQANVIGAVLNRFQDYTPRLLRRLVSRP